MPAGGLRMEKAYLEHSDRTGVTVEQSRLLLEQDETEINEAEE